MRREDAELRQFANEIAQMVEPFQFADLFSRIFTENATPLDIARVFEEAARGLELQSFWKHAMVCWQIAGRHYSDMKMMSDYRLCADLSTMLSRFSHDSNARHQPGTLIDRFIIYYAKQGGMGTAYFCRNCDSDQSAVLKTFQSEDAMDSEARGKFIREAAVLLSIGQHPNIVRAKSVVFDRQDKDRPYLELDYISGHLKIGSSLADHLAKLGKLSIETALKYAIDICNGMNYASSKLTNFIHHDLKPENILITENDNARIADFGLAGSNLKLDLELSITLEGGEKRTLPTPIADEANKSRENVAGTLPFLPPETWTSGKIDLRGDVYALGCILFLMISGIYVYPIARGMSWRNIHTKLDPLKFTDVSINVPDSLQRMVSCCLSKNPAERYQNFQELLHPLFDIYKIISGKQPPPVPKVNPLSINERVDLAVAYSEMGLFSESIQLFNELIAEEPENAAHRYNIGRVYQNHGEHDLAIESYKQAVFIDPKLASGWFNLGICLGIQNSESEESEQAFRKAADLGHEKAKDLIKKIDSGFKGIIIFD